MTHYLLKISRTNYTAIIQVCNVIDFTEVNKEVDLIVTKLPESIKSGFFKNVIATWDNIFVKMGAKPSYKSSLQELYNYYLANAKLYQINPIVDFYNHYSLNKGIPMAAYDKNKIEDDGLALTYAEKGMEFTPLGSPNSVQRTKNGEIVYRDNSKVICRYWNLRDCDETKINDNTRNIIFIFDIYSPEGLDMAKAIYGSIRDDYMRIFNDNSLKSELLGLGAEQYCDLGESN